MHEEEIVFEKSSGTLSRDLGLPDAEERLEKASIAHEIFKAIADRKLTQQEAAKIMGIDQPKVSAIVRGNLKGFSLERLIAFLKKCRWGQILPYSRGLTERRRESSTRARIRSDA